MAIEKISTFCRVCESSCGLIAEREGNEILSLRPDKSHPVTKGFSCPKGILAFDMHKDSDRLGYPMKRINPRRDASGQFERMNWDRSADEIDQRLKAVIQKHGQNAVSVFLGNPIAFNSMLSPAVASFIRKTGISRTFSSGTQDCTNKFAAGEAVFGTSTLHPIPDIENADYLLIVGENPKISHMSFISISDPMSKLKAAARRGAKIRYVNPRRIEAADGTGEVSQIRPDTDLYFLTALLNEIERIGGFREDVIAAHANHIDGLKRFIKNYPPERVEKVVGLSVKEIRDIAKDFSGAEKAAVHMSTGVNMGRQGTLAYWLGADAFPCDRKPGQKRREFLRFRILPRSQGRKNKVRKSLL
jgi:anaerobic selenocysteine-containing dehydrogenase